MGHDATVAADSDAPSITRILPRFIARHPSGEFPAGVARQAHRPFLNWMGCAVGTARHRHPPRHRRLRASAQCIFAATGCDGVAHHVFVEHALGSLQRPMSDDDLARKFHRWVPAILGAAQADDLIAHSMRIASAGGVRALAASARPRQGGRGKQCLPMSAVGRSAKDSTERPLNDAQVPSETEWQASAVKPPVIAVDRSTVPDPDQPANESSYPATAASSAKAPNDPSLNHLVRAHQH